jgi:CxxC-x17-CxxC domain-containing protein
MSEFRKPGGFGGNRNKPDFNGGGNRSGFGGRPEFKRHDSRDQERSQMHTATCDECHKQCEVPFRPTGEKPVYCRECFAKRRESSPESFPKREHSNRDFPRRDFSPSPAPHAQAQDKRIDDLKRQLDAVNSKVDLLLQIVRGDAPAAPKQPEKKVEPKSAPVVKADVVVKKAVMSPKKEEKKASKAEKKVGVQKKAVKKKK